MSDLATIREALEWANKYRSDGNDRRFQEALAVLAEVEAALEAHADRPVQLSKKEARWILGVVDHNATAPWALLAERIEEAKK